MNYFCFKLSRVNVAKSRLLVPFSGVFKGFSYKENRRAAASRYRDHAVSTTTTWRQKNLDMMIAVTAVPDEKVQRFPRFSEELLLKGSTRQMVCQY